ncbi:MAG: hypothetical protein QNJ16_16175 [Rhodobacter sp.]|nr:hypothetical protein [Rhodobacter sp.]
MLQKWLNASRLDSIMLLGLVLFAPISGEAHEEDQISLSIMEIEMFTKEPCIYLLTLQDKYAKFDTDKIVNVKFFHSYVRAVGDILYAGEPDGFALAMGELFRACLAAPGEPLSKIVAGLSK